MSILGVTAYKTTGKDTLCKVLPRASFHPYYESAPLPSNKFFWIVYSDSMNASKIVEFLSIPRERVAFADRLKENVHARLGISHFPLEKLEEMKEQPILVDGVQTTLRELYIEEGARGRKVDPMIWIRLALEPAMSESSNIAVTDVRFQNEISFLNKLKDEIPFLSCRIFRSNVAVPPANQSSEHDLDSILTDLLLVTSTEDFEKAKAIFPQYSNFKPTLIIVEN